jgi:hypothetical protein
VRPGRPADPRPDDEGESVRAEGRLFGSGVIVIGADPKPRRGGPGWRELHFQGSCGLRHGHRAGKGCRTGPGTRQRVPPARSLVSGGWCEVQDHLLGRAGGQQVIDQERVGELPAGAAPSWKPRSARLPHRQASSSSCGSRQRGDRPGGDLVEQDVQLRVLARPVRVGGSDLLDQRGMAAGHQPWANEPGTLARIALPCARWCSDPGESAAVTRWSTAVVLSSGVTGARRPRLARRRGRRGQSGHQRPACPPQRSETKRP